MSWLDSIADPPYANLDMSYKDDNTSFICNQTDNSYRNWRPIGTFWYSHINMVFYMI